MLKTLEESGSGSIVTAEYYINYWAKEMGCVLADHEEHLGTEGIGNKGAYKAAPVRSREMI